MTKNEINLMFTEMVEWLGTCQVMESDNNYYRSIYFPTENRYCNRDTGCVVSAFMHQYLQTGDKTWKEKADLARNYVLDVQQENGGFPEMRGIEKSDDGSTVNTGIIANNLIQAYKSGLEFDQRDLDALRRMAEFELTLEWKPGAFYHDTNHLSAFKEHWGDEGSKRDCQNTNALGASMLLNIDDFLRKNSARVNPEWALAAKRGIEHFLEGQNPDGLWPYNFGCNWMDIGHHAMAMCHLAECAEFAPFNKCEKIKSALIKGAHWLVEEGLIKTKAGNKIEWSIERSACIYFTHSYFLIASALIKVGKLDKKNQKLWRDEALVTLDYLRKRLWDNKDDRYIQEGPFRLTERGIKIGYAWFGQSMGWCLYQLNDFMTL